MSDKLEYITPHYHDQLHRLADTICTPDRLGRLVADNVMLLGFDVPEQRAIIERIEGEE